MSESQKKVDAIYELRYAAEEKARAETALEQSPSPENRDALLDAQLTLEERTVKALTVCHQCGHEHAPGEPHADNVLRPEFPRRSAEGA